MEGATILNGLANDQTLQTLWASYQKKFSYAADLSYADIIKSASLLFQKIKRTN